jgi:2-polyprenyl-3-methyl-5-hydroxy-6-metoxy-1,4-benzoquinol methylase
MLSEILKDFIPLDADKMRFPGFVESNLKQLKAGFDNVKKRRGWRDPNEKCPICNCIEREILFCRFDINYFQCGDCGCAYVEKFPVDTSDIYSDENDLKMAKDAYLKNVAYRKQRFGSERLGLIGRYLDKLPADSDLLDVGCGTGWFLETAIENGYNVTGLEFGKDLASFTANRLNIRVLTDPLTEIKEDLSFDVITMFDVIEHVLNPKEVIKSMHHFLNPGGIGVIFTPNLDSFAIQHYLKEQSSSVTPVHHPFIFHKHSLQKLVEGAGFEVVHFSTKGSDIIDSYAHNQAILKQQQVAGFLKENCNALQAIIDASGCGNHMRFVVRKD